MRTVLIFLLVSFASVGFPKSKDEAPPVDRAAIQEAIKTVGVMPMRIPGFLPEPEALARRFEADVQVRLKAAGFEVVSPDAMREINTRLAKSLGGLYDPMTGEAQKEKVDAHTRFSRNEYLTAHKVDGFLRMAIVQRQARSWSMKASWDGVEERVTGQSRFKSVMTRAAAALGEGTVPALSLVAVLEDRDGKVLYSEVGGLQLMSYIRMGWVPKHVDVDPKFLLTDPARDARALAIVFDPLTGQKTSGKAQIELAPAALAEDTEALRVSRELLLGQHRRVALVALELGDIVQRDAVMARYAQLLKARLGAAGFEVVGGDDFSEIWQELDRSGGGFYDPLTGRLDRQRHYAARREALKRLHQRHGVAAVVFPAVVGRDAIFESGIAKWDGAEDNVSGSKSKLGAMFGASGQFVGQLQALSLQLRFADLEDGTLYEDFGGIQALSRYEQGRFVELPGSQLFSEDARDEKAIELALAELVRRPADQRR